jgi:3-deoxy-D-manno-octulosonic-acid transferase
MVLFFYNLALITGLVASAPWWLWRMVTTRKYRAGLKQRLGAVSPWLRSVAAKNPVVWLHAVSVGEVLAVGRLVAELVRTFPGFQVLVSTTTRTGYAVAQERFGENRVFYCPLDLPWAVQAYLNALNPRLLILAETEFWPNLLDGCFRRNVPVVVVNARISDRSWPRYRMLRRLWRILLGRLSGVLAQSERDAERLKAIGCPVDRVWVSGNLKFDVRSGEQTEATRLLRSLTGSLRLVIAGSTLEGEEATLLAAWPKLVRSVPQLAMVLAPRHPERFSAVSQLLERSGISFLKRSGLDRHLSGELRPIAAGQIILLDTIGELASVYSLAAVAFVGGSLVPSGGHNPLEPAQFAVPIVMGPHYANFRAITDDLREDRALRIATTEDLEQTLRDLLADPEEAAAMGRRARRIFEAQAGATARTMRVLQGLLDPRQAGTKLQPLDRRIEKELRRLSRNGASLQAILGLLRVKAFSQMQSVSILCSVLGVTPADARRAARESQLWPASAGASGADTETNAHVRAEEERDGEK